MSEKPAEDLVILRPSDMLSVLQRAASDPAVDVGKLEALWNLAERMQEKQAKVEFTAALSRLQAKLPQFDKRGHVIVKGVERSRYARLEDMDQIIRPMLAEEGFSISFDEERSDKADHRIFTATLSHREGHAETKHKSMPFDKSDYRSPAQSEGSTVSYARRYLIKMLLNAIETDEDRDGVSPDFVSEEQLRDIETGIADTKGNLAGFLKHFGISELKDLPAREYGEAMQMISAKRRGMK